MLDKQPADFVMFDKAFIRALELLHADSRDQSSAGNPATMRSTLVRSIM